MCVIPGCSWSAQRCSPARPMARGASRRLHVKVRSTDSQLEEHLCTKHFTGFSFSHHTPVVFLLSAVRGCISPRQVLDGKVQELSLNTGRALKFQCDSGYSLVGDPLVVCMGGSAWSSTFPTCQREETLVFWLPVAWYQLLFRKSLRNRATNTSLKFLATSPSFLICFTTHTVTRTHLLSVWLQFEFVAMC